MLKPLTILLALLIIVLRGSGVFFPAKIRVFAERLAASNAALRGTGVFLLGVAVLIYLALGGNAAGARVIIAVFGLLCFFGGILLILLPAQYGMMINWFLKFSDGTISALSSIGLAFGILLLILGIFYY